MLLKKLPQLWYLRRIIHNCQIFFCHISKIRFLMNQVRKTNHISVMQLIKPAVKSNDCRSSHDHH